MAMEMLNRERNGVLAKCQIIKREERSDFNKLLTDIHNTRQRLAKIEPHHERALKRINAKLKHRLDQINKSKQNFKMSKGAESLINWAAMFVQSFSAFQSSHDSQLH